MRSLTSLVQRRQLAAMTYQLTDCLHEGRTVHVSADRIACTAPYAIADLLSIDVAVAA